jgi:hypothetical protein
MGRKWAGDEFLELGMVLSNWMICEGIQDGVKIWYR